MTESQHTPPPGLAQDGKRSAAASFRGDMFQVWHSVFAWLNLEGDEKLFLEAAEDFDVWLAPTDTKTTQVKDVRGNLTLRSKGVTDAINHFWKHRTDNPKIRVSHRFLTTASIGIEEGGNFGEMGGLRMWEEARSDDAAATSVKLFLLEESRFDKKLQEFIRDVPIAVLKQELFQRIEWIFDSPSVDAIKRDVVRRLVDYGSKRKAMGIASEKVAARLYVECCENIVRRGSSLHYSDFILIFEAEVSVSFFPTDDAPFPSKAILRPDFTPRGIVKPFPRQKAVDSLLSALSGYEVRNLQGASGAGKTTLAFQVYGNLENSRWLDCRKVEPFEVSELLRFAVDETKESRSPLNWIVDNIDFNPGAVSEIKADLATFVAEVKKGNGTILFTSTIPCPNSTRLGLGLSEKMFIAAPPFGGDEIREFAVFLGCPSTKAESLAAICDVITKGHAQCVHAFLAAAGETGWQSEESKLFVSGMKGVGQVQDEAFRLLSSFLDQDQRELLNRLSLITGYIRPDHAVQIAEIEPAIPLAGEKFRQLCGPWLEEGWSGYFSVSPLLEQCGQKNLTSDNLERMRRDIALALASCAPITIHEGSNMLRLLLETAASWELGELCGKIMEYDPSPGSHLLRPLSWFAFSSLKGGRVLYSHDLGVSSLLRSIQFRVALSIEVSLAAEVADAWHNECYTNNTEPHGLMLKALLAGTVLFRNEVKISAERVISYIEVLLDWEALAPDSTAIWQSGIDREKVLAEAPVLAAIKTQSEICILHTLPRFETLEEIESLLEVLERTSTSVRESILDVWNRFPVNVGLLANRIWLSVEEAKPAKWDESLRVLNKAARCFTRWGCPEGAAEAIRGIGIVWDEYLGNCEEAEKSVQALALELNCNSPTIDYALANIAFSGLRYSDAIALFQRVIGLVRPDTIAHDIMPFQSARLLGMSLAKLGRYQEAARVMLEGGRSYTDQSYPQFRVGLIADAGIAFFKCEMWPECVSAFSEAIFKARTLGGREEPADFQVKKLLSNSVLGAFRREQSDQETKLVPLEPGICSRLEVNEKAAAELPDYIESGVVALLMVFAVEHDCVVGEELRKSFFAEAPPEQMSMVLLQTARNYIRRGDVATLPLICLDGTRNLKSITPPSEANVAKFAAIPEGTKEFNPQQPIYGQLALVAGILAANHHRGISAKSTVLSWLQTLEQCEKSQDLVEWLAMARGILEIPDEELEKRFLAQTLRNSEPLVSSAHLLGLPGLYLETYFVAGSVLCLSYLNQPWCNEVESILSQSFRRAMFDVCERPFRLPSPPTVTQAAIRSICESGDSFSAFARMIVGMAPYSQKKLPPQILETFASVSKWP